MRAFVTFITKDWYIAWPMFMMSIAGITLVVWRLLLNINSNTNLAKFLPEFQRAYVWKPSQVVRLLDSLYMSYPTGQILLWDPTELPTTRGLEGVVASGLPSPGRPKVVLDGQQRLTSLLRALSGDAKDPVEVAFKRELIVNFKAAAFRSEPRRRALRRGACGRVR